MLMMYKLKSVGGSNGDPVIKKTCEAVSYLKADWEPIFVFPHLSRREKNGVIKVYKIAETFIGKAIE